MAKEYHVGEVNMVTLGFKYGESEINLSLPEENLKIIKNKSFPGIENPEKAVSEALDNPIGMEPISKLVSPGDKVSIIVDDVTRDTPTSILFPIVYKKLKEAGIKNRDINIVMATGAHKRQSEEDLLKRIGGRPSGDIKLSVHDPLDKSRLSLIGFTSLGTPVWINDEVAESDFKIGIGSIRPHAEAGFSGGGKIILPGVSAWEAIGRNHILFISRKSRIGILEGNPFREDIEECAEIAGLNFIVNTVWNTERKIAGVYAGHPIKAQREGVKTVKEICENRLDEKADILIMGFGPKDDTVWQIVGTAFTLSTIDRSVKKGGTILLIASCEDGVYMPFKGVHHLNYEGTFKQTQKFVELLTTSPSPEELFSITLRGKAPYPELGAKGVVLSQLSKAVNLVMVSNNLKSEDVNWFGELVWGPDKALKNALEEHGRDANIIVMPNISGPEGCPSMKPFPYTEDS